MGERGAAVRRRAGRDPDQQPGGGRDAPGHGGRLAVRHGDHLVDQRDVGDGADEAAVEAGDPVRPRGASRQQGRALRLHRDDAQPGVALAQVAGGSGERAAGPDPAHQHVDLTAGGGPDLRSGGRVVGHDVGGVLVLAGVPGPGEGGVQLRRPVHAALEAEGVVGELDPRAQHAQGQRALPGGVVRHHDHARVSPADRERRQGDAGVAGGRLDHGGAGGQRPGRLGLLDHAQRHPVLDARQRVGRLQLGEHGDVRGQAVEGEPEQGRVADEVVDPGRDVAADQRDHACSFSATSRYSCERLVTIGPSSLTGQL